MAHVNSLMAHINLDCEFHAAKILSDGYIFHYCILRQSHNVDCALCHILKEKKVAAYQLQINFDEL